VDFATVASLQRCSHVSCTFHDCSMTTDEIVKKHLMHFVIFLKIIGFHAKGKLRGTKSVLQCSTFLCLDTFVSWPSLFSIPHHSHNALYPLFFTDPIFFLNARPSGPIPSLIFPGPVLLYYIDCNALCTFCFLSPHIFLSPRTLMSPSTHPILTFCLLIFNYYLYR
jgi:hypothetical protein